MTVMSFQRGEKGDRLMGYPYKEALKEDREERKISLLFHGCPLA